MAVREVLQLAYAHQGVTGGLSRTRASIARNRAAAAQLRQGLSALATAGAAAVTLLAAESERAQAKIASNTGTTGAALESVCRVSTRPLWRRAGRVLSRWCRRFRLFLALPGLPGRRLTVRPWRLPALGRLSGRSISIPLLGF